MSRRILVIAEASAVPAQVVVSQLSATYKYVYMVPCRRVDNPPPMAWSPKP